MELTTLAEERAFREEARDWLNENIPTEKRPPGGGAETVAFDREWQRKQYDGGFAGLSWPKEHGGRGLSLDLQVIWFEEYARANAPDSSNSLYVGLNHAGPTLIARGTADQQSKHLDAILSAEDVWCQGFSEPGAGSDLAAQRTTGVIDGDDIVINGQKIWTSFGNHAKYQELLIRTDSSGPKHHGITWIIGQMDLPGVDIRPIRSIAGADHFCEVYYTDVRIPLANVVGEVNEGWSVAMSTLGFERGTASLAHQLELTQTVERLIAFAKENTGPDGRRMAYEDDEIRRRLARARVDVSALRALTLMSISRARKTQTPGAEGSVTRLYFSELVKRVAALAYDLIGPRGLEMPGLNDWSHRYLEDLRHSIAGGTSEIQRNIIGERLLGLPRQAVAAKTAASPTNKVPA